MNHRLNYNLGKCSLCGIYFQEEQKESQEKPVCLWCEILSSEDAGDDFSEYNSDIEILVHPNGRTEPVFYDD